MSRRTLLTIAGGLALVVVVVIGLRQAPDSSAPEAAVEQAPTPAEARRLLAGAPPELAALHRRANDFLPGGGEGVRRHLRRLADAGHPVVLNFWAAWCGPCREELPILQRVSVDQGRRVAFLGVDLRDDRESATRLLARFPVSYPSYEDTKGKLFNDYGLQGAPSTVFYDARGRQTYIHQGPYLQRRQLEADIRRYAPPAPA